MRGGDEDGNVSVCGLPSHLQGPKSSNRDVIPEEAESMDRELSGAFTRRCFGGESTGPN
jgi:hypothetical protein